MNSLEETATNTELGKIDEEISYVTHTEKPPVALTQISLAGGGDVGHGRDKYLGWKTRLVVATTCHQQLLNQRPKALFPANKQITLNSAPKRLNSS